MTNTSKLVLAAVAVVVLALGGGMLGSQVASGGEAGGDGAVNGSFLEDIKASGELRVGVAISPPHTVELKDGTLGGPNLIPLEMLAEALDVEVKVVPAEWKNIVAGLQAGRYDFAANLDRTLERSVAVQFSEPVWEYPAVFVVPADSPYSTVEELLDSGEPIGTAQGTAHEASFVRQYPDAKTVAIDSFSNMLSSLRANRTVASLTDLPTAVSQAQEDDTLRIILPEKDIYRGLVAYGILANADARSMQSVNIAIERALNEGVMEAAYQEVGYLDETQLDSSGLLKQ